MKTFIVDSFTLQPFKGNPAGVCLVEEPTSDYVMLSIAHELGLSETAFVHVNNSTGTIGIRYFSPKMEIPLCGHATLAAAKVLKAQGVGNKIQFETGEKVVLNIEIHGDNLAMEFPLYKTTPTDAPAALLQSLGISKLNNSVHNTETNILMIEIESHEQLANLEPDFAALVKSHDAINGVLVTAQGSASGHDFSSRYFWPWSGTNEDPVTGATHTFLAGYWSDRLNKTHLRSFQASARTGEMEVRITPDQKVVILGNATIILEGNIVCPL